MAEGGDGSKEPFPKENKNEPEKQKEEGLEDDSSQTTSEWLMSLMKKSLKIGDAPKPEKILTEPTFEAVIEYILSGKCKKIITMAGAGISTSAGIPDFRSPGTGLYDNLQKYNLPSPQAIFEINFFMENPEPFFTLAKELFPTTFKPTPCHYFLRILHEKGLLLRHFTQNIDTLEHVAGLPSDKIVEAHGTFHTSHCLKCQKEFSQEWIKDEIFADKIPKCDKADCEGLVKPDIVFFGEALPTKFFQCVQSDLPKCDLLIIMGTSLVVQPFASLTSRVPDTTPRLYINMEQAPGTGDPMMALFGMGHNFLFESEDNYRDVFWQGTCDDGCSTLADKLGWGDELQKLVEAEHARIDKETESANAKDGTKETGKAKADESSKKVLSASKGDSSGNNDTNGGPSNL